MLRKIAFNHPAVLIFAVLLVVFISFLPSLGNEFVNWDDDVHLLDNLSVRSLSPANIWAIFTTAVNKTYIPLTTLSFAVEHYFAGFNPFVYHLDNLILHLFCVVLVFIFVRGLGISQTPSILAALLFGIHPTHVESVAWVTERKDVLYALFYLAALCFYGMYRKNQKRSTYRLTIICGILSMLAKPMALSLPLVFLLYDWFTGRKINRKVIIEKLPHFLYVIPLAWITYSLNARVPMESVINAPLVWIWTFSFYIWKFLWPVHLVPLYQLPQPISLLNPHYIFAVFIFAAVLIFAVRKKDRIFNFAFLFYFLTIFFLLRFDDAKDATVVSDRFLYIPSIGFCVLIGILIQRALRKYEKIKPAILFVSILLFAFFAVKTFLQCGVWKSSLTLWDHQLRYYPDSPLAINDLATAYSKQKYYLAAVKHFAGGSPSDEDREDIEEVKGMYEKAIALNPTYEDAYYNLGNTYQDLGKQEESISFYLKAIELNPEYADAYFNLGKAYVKTGKPEEAVAVFQKMVSLTNRKEDAYFGILKIYNNAIKDNPDAVLSYQAARGDMMEHYGKLCEAERRADCYFNVGSLYGEAGEPQKALSYFEKTLALNPRYEKALYNIGNIYSKSGDFEKAAQHYEKALAIDPYSEETYLNFGLLYAGQKDFDRAISLYQDALRKLPRSANIYFNLGFVYETLGRTTQAISAYQQAQRIKPTLVEVYYGLGNCFAVRQQWEQAAKHYGYALDYAPAHVGAMANLSFVSFQLEKFDDAVLYFKKARDLGFRAPPEYERVLQPYLQ